MPLVPNVGIIVGSDAALVVDAGLGPGNGDTVRRHADELAGDRALLLTVTHFHPEHGYGAQAFEPGATILYNRAQLDELHDKGQRYISWFSSLGRANAEQLDGTVLVEPRLTYDGAADLDLGGLTVQLRTWGLAHTRADQVVFLPESRILFTGDLVETDLFPIFPYLPPDDVEVDGDRWIAVLQELERLDPALVVPGHGAPGDVGLIVAVREYIQLIRSEVRRMADDGASRDAIASQLDGDVRARYPDWGQPEWIALTAQCLYDAYARTRGG